MKNKVKVDRLIRSISGYHIGMGDVVYSRVNGKLHHKIKQRIESIIKQARAISLDEEL